MASASELAILRKYAAGAEIATIVTDLKLSRDTVAEVISGVNYQRGRAAEVLRQLEATLVKPAAREATVHIEPRPDTIEQRLLRAEAIPRLKARAARIRAMLDDLGRDLEAAAQVVEAERKVEQLRADLAAATDALRQMTRPAAKKPAADAPAVPQSAPDPVVVRKWAADNGVDCSPKGRVKQEIVDRYLAAQQLAA